MSTKSRLNKLYKTCQRIRLPENVKILFFADLHMGDGGPEDDFKKNKDLCYRILKQYIESGFIIYFLGDIEDLWEANREQIVSENIGIHSLITAHTAKNHSQLKGNHDNSLGYPEAVVLQIGDMEIFCCHGHQGDLFNDKLYWIGKYAVKIFWVPFQWLGLYDLGRAKKRRHELQEIRLTKWAKNQPFNSVFGHTHFLAKFDQYKNAGCWVEQGGEAIEYSNGKFEERRFP